MRIQSYGDYECHTDSATGSSATTSHTVSIKEPEAPKMIYQVGHTHLEATVLANTLLERAVIAEAITAS